MPLTSPIRQYAHIRQTRTEWLRTNNALGIELEYENLPSGLADIPSWHLTSDGSLRDNGGEWVSIPLPFDGVDAALERAESSLAHSGVVASLRCGLHTHMNMRPYSVGQVWSLVTLYALIEPTLYDQYAVGREGNMFAVPLYLNNHQVRALYDDINGIRAGTSRQCSVTSTSKYSALNFHRLADLGTLEMRQPYCTTNFDAIRSWTDFCKMLVTVGTLFADPHHVLDEYERGGLEELQERLFGEAFPIDPDIQELAEDAAYYVGGYREPQWNELEWEVA